METTNFLENELLKITLGLYFNLKIPRNVVQFFMETLENFVKVHFINFFKQQLVSLNYNSNGIDKILKDFDEILRSFKLIFDKFSTEYDRFNYYKKKNLMFNSVEDEIGHKYSDKFVDGLDTDKIPLKSSYIPLKWSLKSLLESPGVFKMLTDYMAKLYSDDSGIKSNQIQCELWKALRKNFGKKFVVPVNVFTDDCQLGHIASSQAAKTKIGATYVNIPCFPPFFASKLYSILLYAIHFTKDRKLSTNDEVYSTLIAELNDLRENGIKLFIDNEEYPVYFQLCLFLGDNLGLNEALGFVECFSSGKPCRFCSASIEQIRALFTESPELIRTVESYKIDCKLKNSKLTGIKEECAFNQVDGYHAITSSASDMMHDEVEGEAEYLLTKLLNHSIYEKRYFTLDYLNAKIKDFDYGFDNSNKLPPIKEHHIKKIKKIKMSAAEILFFSRNLSLFIAEKMPKIVESNDEHWNVYFLFRKILAIATSPRMVEGHLGQLDSLIPQFLKSYKDLYGDLQYKFHNLTHLVRVMRKNGPPVGFWSMRFEAYHKLIKLMAATSNNKKSIQKTIEIRSQLRLAYLKCNKIVNYKEIKYEDADEIDER